MSDDTEVVATPPAVPDLLPESMGLDEFEEQNKELEAPAEPAPKGVLENDDPQIVAMREALRISEEARKEAISRAAQRTESAPAPQAAPRASARELYTDEQLAELAEQHGVVAAIRAAQNQVLRMAEETYAPFLQGVQGGAVSSAEQHALVRYPLEFELFGDEIREFARNMPDKSMLATADGWANLVAYVRGRDANLDKYVERKAAVKKEGPSTAQAEQRRTAGFSAAPAAASARPSAADIAGGGTHGLDDVERKVADTMGISYADYAKYKRM